MTATALPQTQAGLYQAIKASSAVMALVNGVYDAVPQTPSYPHLVIGEAAEVPNRTMGQGGHTVTATISIYTRDGATEKAGKGSTGFATGLAIAQALNLLIVEGFDTVVIADHTVILIEEDEIATSRDADGITRYVDVKYRIELEDAS